MGCERDGIISLEASVQFDSGRLRTGLEVIANHLGKRLDEDNPLLHAQLRDGSRLAAVIPPVVRPAPALTIRKFISSRFTVDDLIARGTLSRSLADYLSEQIRNGKTILISGGTGTGKTTFSDTEGEIAEAVDFVAHVERKPGRRVVSEVLAIRGYDRDAKRFLIEPVTEGQYAAA